MTRDATKDDGEPQPDPVELVRGEPIGLVHFLCSHCGSLQLLDAPLPVGGVACTECSDHVAASDRLEFAGLRPRILAITIDLALAAALYFILSLFTLPFSPLIPRDEDGDPTERFLFWSRSVSLAIVFVYLAHGDIIGVTLGKAFAGIRVVRRATVRRPGLFVGLARNLSKTVTVATAGLAISCSPGITNREPCTTR